MKFLDGDDVGLKSLKDADTFRLVTLIVGGGGVRRHDAESQIALSARKIDEAKIDSNDKEADHERNDFGFHRYNLTAVI